MSMFKGFSDVTVRDELKTEKSDLEKVIDVEEEIIKQYKNDERFELYSRGHFEAYRSLYQTTQEKLTDIKITQEILQGYIDAGDNTEENTQARIRGMYSASLLEIISTKTPETTTVIDGRGKTFNYLFYHIHNVKNLTLTNITGGYILKNAGSNHGRATNITLSNIKGNSSLQNAGIHGGSATNITLTNITGNNTLIDAGSHNGSATNITLNDITGDCTLYYAGLNGSVTNITLTNITGNNTLYDAGSHNGSAINITLTNIQGYYTLFRAGENNGSAKNIILTNIKGAYLLFEAGAYNGSVANILQENQLNKKQKSILSQIETITETMHVLSLEEQSKAHDEIASLQKELFAGET